MNIGMIILKQGIKTMQNYVIWILTALFIQIRTKDFDKNFAEYGKKKRFDTSNYEADKPLPKGMNKKVIGLLKEKTRREDYDRNFALRLKTYSY